jgi:parvulin-like peptidyl-prolyl isomerase
MIDRIKQLLKRLRHHVYDENSENTESSDIRVTNETIAAQREEVLGSARKYIYPLQAPKHRVVKLSLGILIAAVIIFFGFCTLELYKFQSTASFIYGVTQVIPFPVAVIENKDIVSYNSYLFELRHYMHYYQTQQNVNFTTTAGKQQLSVFKQRSLDQALQNVYVNQLAQKNHISVSADDVNNAVALVRSENRLGANNQVFQNVLSEFYGWSINDFKRELSQELLAQMVVNRLDTATHLRADKALTELHQGTDFAALAKQVSDDSSTRSNGGDYGTLIDQSNTDIAPQIIEELFRLHSGQYSGIINTGYSLEIVKVLAVQGNEVRAAHIEFNFQPITTYTNPLEASEKPHLFIHI